jgi:type II secretory pathway component PulM
MATFDQFIRALCCGEVMLRRKILSCFAEHLKYLSSRTQREILVIVNFLLGLIAYYGQFSIPIERSIETSRCQLQSPVLELAALSRWYKEADLGSSLRMDRQRDRDLEYHRLKAASEHTLIELLTICREMDAALGRPAAEILWLKFCG